MEGRRLKVVHRHGPCASFKNSLSQKQILENDQARVEWIHYMTTKQEATLTTSLTKITANRGDYYKIPEYIVNVGFGTPSKDQTLAFDTGSDLTWIQCQPCKVRCYPQKDPIFDPSQSSTYSNISCSSADCSQLKYSGCNSGTCLYRVVYGASDVSAGTVGFFAEDTVTLSSTNIIPNFKFGCSENYAGDFGEIAGLLGLGRGTVSFVSQTYQIYNGIFSYCLPSTSSSAGYLQFGSADNPSNVQFTRMLTDNNTPTYYYVELTGISVGGNQLSISPSVFSTSGTIVDSGTVITRLPPTAYSDLRSAFQEAMSGYKSANDSTGFLDTCYDFSGNSGDISVPTVELKFGGDVTMNLDVSGILIGFNESLVCLAFAANDDDNQRGIFGNVQQRKFNVVYDLSKKVIGFGPGGC